jgi:hypothetical protein
VSASASVEGRALRRRRGALLLGSMVVTFVVVRVALHAAPDTDLDVGPYDVHHLFTGLLLVAAGGLPLAMGGQSCRWLDVATIAFGCGLALALDEWVYLIVTDGSNAAYVGPASLLGGAALVGLACGQVAWLWRRNRTPSP